MKCDLVNIFNHQYEKNIPLLDWYYGDRFNRIWHLSPFSRSVEKNIIPVYDGSFTFQSFVAQAWRTLRESNADYYLFASDDLLIDPDIHQGNIEEHFSLARNGAFISQLHDLSTGEFSRGVIEVKKMRRQNLSGLEHHQHLPDSDKARRMIQRYGLLQSEKIHRYHPFDARYQKPYLGNISCNWRKFKTNVWHRREQFRHFLNPVTMPYPVVGGNSDIFIVPRERMDEFARLCGIFAAMRIFVELAIPTALVMSCEEITTEKTTVRKGVNYVAVWRETETIERGAILKAVENSCSFQLETLKSNWPSDYLYLHPLKLSKWKTSLTPP